MTKKLFAIISACILLMICVSACKQSSGSSFETPPPAAPTIPKREATSESTITISWGAVEGATGGYDIYSGATENPASATKHNTSGVIDTDYMITDLDVTTKYYIWLKAKNAGGDSAFSPSLMLTTSPAAKSSDVLKVPVPKQKASTNTSITISWDAVEGANGYYVYVDSAKRNESLVTALSYTITNLTAETEYNITLKAKNSKATSNLSSPLMVKTMKKPRTFNALRIKASGPDEDITVMANHVTSTTELEIYLQVGATMTQQDIDYIATNFATDYPTLTDIYGTHTDVDGNGNKIIILLYEMNENSAGSYTAGYFWHKDLLKPDPNDWTALSNEAEILYVESEVSGEIKGIYDTVIHEFQHLINYHMNATLGSGQSDVWLNEALAESTAIVKSGGMPANRLIIYNDIKYPNAQLSYHDSIETGNYFYYWNTDQYVLADYATASLFMYWLYLNGGGTTATDIFKNIAHATERGGYEAVLEAVGKSTGSLKSLTTWENVLFAWLKANENESVGYKDGIFTGIDENGNVASFPITNMIRTKVYPGDGTQSKANLFSGGAILTGSATGTHDLLAKDTFFSNQWIDGSSNPLNVYITLNKSTLINTTYIGIPLSSVALVRNAARRSNFPFPILLDEGYRIVPRSQTLLQEGDFE